MKRLSLIAALAATCSAYATDGVIEINDAKIMANGGYPYTISQPGSYRLTSNLSLLNKYVDGIIITAEDVSLDLNGFAIVGPNVCSVTGAFPNQAMSCSNNGAGAGIRASTDRVRVGNGSVTGAGSYCVRLTGASGGQVHKLEVSHCGFSGLNMERGTVDRVYAHHNLGVGIRAQGSVRASVAETNGGAGMYVSGVVIGNVVRGNLSDGFASAPGAFVGNYAYANQGDGLQTAAGSVIGNAAVGNGGWGFDAVSAAFSQNLADDNGAGQTTGTTSVPANSNLCHGSPC